MALTANPAVPTHDGSKPFVGGALRMAIVAGAASGTLLTVTGMEAGDQVWYVHNLDQKTDLTADVTSVQASGFKLSGASTNAEKLQVGWTDRKG